MCVSLSMYTTLFMWSKREAYEFLIPTVLFNCLFPGWVPYSNWFIQLLIPWMSPLFQLVYSTAYSLDESLIPTGLFNCLFPGWVPYSNWFYSTTVLFNSLFPGWVPFSKWFYSTAYSLDESLIPTGLIQEISSWIKPVGIRDSSRNKQLNKPVGIRDSSRNKQLNKTIWKKGLIQGISCWIRQLLNKTSWNKGLIQGISSWNCLFPGWVPYSNWFYSTAYFLDEGACGQFTLCA